MNSRTGFKKLLAVAFSLTCFLAVTLPQPARAAMISTQQSLLGSSRAADLATVRAWLERDQVRAQLEAYGVSPERAAERVAALTNAELRKLAQAFGAQPAGGLLEVLGVVFVVLLILEVTGVTDIFKKI